MNVLSKVTLCCVATLMLVAGVGAMGQQNVRARVGGVEDRPAAPSFGLANASGRLAQLSGFRGKPVVLNLWATECGGGQARVPVFLPMDQPHKGRGLGGVGGPLGRLHS